MVRICLPVEYANRFLEALRKGEIDPDKLIKMSSAERRSFFEKIVGKENAKFVNTEFESKLLLKNRGRGLVTWAERMAGLRKYKDKDLVEKIKSIEKALTPDEQNHILEDIVEKRLGVEITTDEAKKIIELTNKIENLYKPEKELSKQSYEYWKTRVELNKFIKERLRASVKSPSLFLNKEQYGKVKGALKTAGDWLMFGVEEMASFLRSMKAGWDMSAPFRQGGAYIGKKEWRRAFRNMFKYARSEIFMDDLEIEMMRSKWADELLDVKKELGLTILGVKPTQMEEQFTGRLFRKIPVARGSERAYVGFLNDLRFRRFTNILDNLEKLGRKDILENKEKLRQIAEVVGAATGRGKLPRRLEPMINQLATALFSPRFVASRIRILINPINYHLNPLARKEAALALARQAGFSLSMLGLFAMIAQDDKRIKVEINPLSSDFGKVVIGNTRIDMTAGLAPYIVLMVRLKKGEYISPTTGVSKLLTSGFGQMTRWDLARNFVEYKFSPLFQVFRDTLRGKTFEGDELGLDTPEKKKNSIKYLVKMFEPLVVQDAREAFEDGSAGVLPALGASIGSFFGLNINTYKLFPQYQVRDLYKEGDVEGAKELLDDYVEKGKLTKKQKDKIWKEIDIPNDVLYYKRLSRENKIKFLKKRAFDELYRYYWESPKDIRKNFDKISDDEKFKRFKKLVDEHKINRPKWRYQRNIREE